MLNFIQAEFLKLKNSKIFVLSILGALFPPFLMGLGIIEDTQTTYTFQTLYNVNNEYVIALFAVLLCAIIISYLVGREYEEHTLKSIITVPVSRFKYLIGKYLMFLIWTLILMTIILLSSTAIGFVTGCEGFTTDLFFNEVYQLIGGGFLLFLAMAPFIFIAMIVNNMVPAMVGGAALILVNMLAYSRPEAPYFPWIAPYLIVSGNMSQYTCPDYIPYLVILITFAVGFLLSYIYFVKRDIRL